MVPVPGSCRCQSALPVCSPWMLPLRRYGVHYLLFSLFCGLKPRLGFKANEQNGVKPVVVCKSKEAKICLQVRIMYLGRLVWSRKRLGRLFGFGKTRTEVGKLSLIL